MNTNEHTDKARINRRRFLKVVAATAVGGTAATIFGFETRASSAVIDIPTSVIQTLERFNYGGKSIELMDLGGNQQMLHINGVALPEEAFARIDSGYASSMLLPFETFPSAKALARKLIDGDGKLFILSGSHAM